MAVLTYTIEWRNYFVINQGFTYVFRKKNLFLLHIDPCIRNTFVVQVKFNFPNMKPFLFIHQYLEIITKT